MQSYILIYTSAIPTTPCTQQQTSSCSVVNSHATMHHAVVPHSSCISSVHQCIRPVLPMTTQTYEAHWHAATAARMTSQSAASDLMCCRSSMPRVPHMACCC
jgi:hypothetical protein